MPQRQIDAGVLGKLLVIQQTLEVMPDEGGMASFLGRALQEVPGIRKVHLCVNGVLYPSDPVFSAQLADCAKAGPECCLENFRAIPSVFAIPLRTPRMAFGAFITALDDEAAFAPYRDFIHNIANALASHLETRQHLRQLDEANASLRRARDELERRVEERTAELRAAKEQAEAATLLKDKFVSLVSHDLKSPLSSMIGFLKLLRDDIGEPLNEGEKLVLTSAISSGTQMARLIDDLLSISRLKTGQIKLIRQFFDANYLGLKMIADYSSLARQKGIEMKNTIPDNSRIYGDKTLLTEAIQNLVTNAIKFCKSGDRITISLAEDDISTICIRDTGPGIRADLLDNIFKYEKKISTEGTAGETGTGLGLPLAKDIIEFHGGELGVKSEPGKGCLFSLKLPYVRPIILLVDDDKNFRYLQIRHLREMNANIIEAENGKEALKIMKNLRPHLIITDIKMPVMDGLELLKTVRSGPDTKNIPVIVVSGEYGMEIRDTIFKLGADDFATKDIDTVDFLPRVRRFIG